jgi:hypothetical protein
VDVYDDAIMPGLTFALDTISNAPECKVDEPYGYSAPTEMSTTTEWGDVVGNDCGTPPCTVPQGVVDQLDISVVVDKFKNEPWAQIKARADLINSTSQNPLPDRKVDFVDVSLCVDAFGGFPNGNPYPGPNLEDFDCPPYFGDCYANITVDSNNDGEINEFDDAVEDTSAMYLVVNSDDDDDSGVSDFNEAPVDGEDDLAEIRLTAACDGVLPEFAWWSLSWDDDPPVPIQVWRYPDKSDDGDGDWPGDPIVNGQQYDEWAPPDTVWLEAFDTFGDLEMTFTFDQGTALLGRFADAGSTKSDKAKAGTGPCKNRGASKRYHIVAKKQNNMITRVSANIDLKVQEPCSPLCPEPCKLWQIPGNSAMFVVVVRKDSLHQGKKLWASMGYARRKRRFSNTVKSGQYAEMSHKWSTGAESDTEFSWLGEPPTPGPYKYQVSRRPDGKWEFTTNTSGLDQVVRISDNTWPDPDLRGSEVHWSTELLNVEDRLCGTSSQRCEFTQCEYDVNGMLVPNDPLAAFEIVHDPLTPGDNEWGIQWVNGTSFKVWDKRTSIPCEEP